MKKGVILKFMSVLSSTYIALVLKEPKTKTSVRKVFLLKTVANMFVKHCNEVENHKKHFVMNTRIIIWYSLRSAQTYIDKALIGH